MPILPLRIWGCPWSGYIESQDLLPPYTRRTTFGLLFLLDIIMFGEWFGSLT